MSIRGVVTFQPFAKTARLAAAGAAACIPPLAAVPAGR